MKKLYIVSIGPGDPELLTLKAYKTIQKSDAVCIPTKSENSFDKSRTYEIIKEATNSKQRLIPIIHADETKKRRLAFADRGDIGRF